MTMTTMMRMTMMMMMMSGRGSSIEQPTENVFFEIVKVSIKAMVMIGNDDDNDV